MSRITHIRVRKDFWNDEYLECRDSSGHLTYQRETTDFWGDKHTIIYDRNWKKIADIEH